MISMVMQLLQTYGTDIQISDGSGVIGVVGVIQPVRSKSWDAADSEYSPLGEIPRGRYVYLGPVNPMPRPGHTLIMGDKSYLLRRVEVIYGPGGPAYCWGLCLEKGGVDNWGQRL